MLRETWKSMRCFARRVGSILVVTLLAPLTSHCMAQPQPRVTSVQHIDAVCAKCHKDIFNRYARTPMANASGLAMDHAIPGILDQGPTGLRYTVSLDGGELWLTYRSSTGEALSGKRRLEYFLGSGHLGVTYMYVINGYLLESPIAYYSNLNAYDMKPGLQRSQTMAPALPMSSECMRCHMSEVQTADKGTMNHYQGLPFLHGGITCESCHGDTRDHVLHPGPASVINPAKLDADRRDSICISCHLEGDTSVEHRGQSLANYRPGDRIEEFVSYFTYRDENFSNRGVSEVEELSTSKCKLASGDRMSCTTCHDPHGGPAPEERTSYYRAKCLTCHIQATFATGHYPGTPDCTHCHMPSGNAQNIPHVAWTDHRIRTVANQVELTTLAAPSSQPAKLVPFLGEKPSPRDQALAYYNLVLDGKLNYAQEARRALLDLDSAEADDPSVLAALGYLNQIGREPSAAIGYYREALKREPRDLFSSNNLGTRLAASGQLQEARSLWEDAFQLNEDIESLGLNLALADCKLGEKAEAQKVLARVLLYSPGSLPAQRKLAALNSGQKLCTPK
jgi:predicted CXXCH cytochrome family protein